MKELTKKEKSQLYNIQWRLQEINDLNKDRRKINYADRWEDEIQCKIQDAIMALQEINPIY